MREKRATALCRMVDFGKRSAATFWVISLTILVLNWIGITTVTFLQVWSWVTIYEKSLKMIPTHVEEIFLNWSANVWDSIQHNPSDSRGSSGLDQMQNQPQELGPIYRP